MSKKHGHGYNKKHVITNHDSPLFDDYEEESMCLSKNGYDSEWQAQFIIEESFKRDGTKLTAYLCPYCNKWHLTSDNNQGA